MNKVPTTCLVQKDSQKVLSLPDFLQWSGKDCTPSKVEPGSGNYTTRGFQSIRLVLIPGTGYALWNIRPKNIRLL